MAQKTLSKKLKQTKKNKSDKEFGILIYELKNTAFHNLYLPLCIILIGSFMIIFGNQLIEPMIWYVVGTILLLIGVYMLGNFLFDRLYFYENGMIQSSILNPNKIRISYHNLKEIQIESKTFKIQRRTNSVTWYKFISPDNQIIFQIQKNTYQNLDSVITTVKKELHK